jgi:hypothetical protein
MKERSQGFLSEEKIDHESEPFKYIVELHDYLWRFVRVIFPGAQGQLSVYLDAAIDIAEKRQEARIKGYML